MKPLVGEQSGTVFEGRAIDGSWAIENEIVRVRTALGEKTAPRMKRLLTLGCRAPGNQAIKMNSYRTTRLFISQFRVLLKSRGTTIP